MQPSAPTLAGSSVAIALGPFVLQRLIGAGGMGEVWQGVHAEEHVPVAIKVIGPAWARHAAHRRAFQREVRAVAGLSHPGIVAVFDDGVVDAAAAARSDGRLAEGSPYLAMEYMPRGSLEGLLPALDWPLVQVIVEGTLAALAHAHARGVIHCDLKPANILLSGWSEVAIKLTDFGVAHALGPGGDEEGEGAGSSAGTPAYMAPEQLLGQSRDYGPWTDLYALGCTAWEMCCAHPPFMAADLPRLAGQHLYEEPGPFRPVFPVPPGVEPWLRRLLAKRPQGRFARAADALARLRALGRAAPVAWSAVAARTEALAERSPTRPAATRGGARDPTRQVSRVPRALAAELTASVDAVQVRADTLPRAPVGPAGTLLAHGPGGVPRAPVDDPLGRTVLADGPGVPGELAGMSVGAGGNGQVVADMASGAGPQGQAVEVPVVRRAADGELGRTLPAPRGAAPPVHVPIAVSSGTGVEDIAPFPATWRLPHDAAASRPLLGAGLGLVGVRELPLIGRDGERDRIWAALARVREGGQPGLLLVRGPSGVGKSRLVEWTAARAHELGAAEVLRAAHGPFGGPAEGLPRMLAVHLRCVGLGGDATYDRCLAAVAPGGVDETARLAAAALTEIVCPGDDGPGRPRVRLQDARERYHVLAGYLALVAAARPALVWIDDAQWAPGALELVRHCLRAGEPRALFVATVRDDLLAERPAEAELIAELAGLPGAETMSVGPLPEDQHHALVEELLGLERRLVDAIVARTGGNPLFSVELVGDWAARGLLRPGPGGFVLREGAEVDLPDDLHALWRRRVEGLLARHFPGAVGEAARIALELAAAIGQEIDGAGWAHACALAGVAAPPDLALVLVRERLAAATSVGWSFSHGMLRESLERMAEEAGRAAAHHRICARMVRELGERGPGASEEVARHLIAAGDLRDALAPLLAASYELQLAGQYGRAEAALGEHAALCDRLGLSPDDRERLHGRMQGAWLAWMRGGEGASERGQAEVAAIADLARARGHDDVLGEALRWRGLVARFARRWDDSLAALAGATECFRRTGDAEGLARTALARAVTLRATGQLEAAEERLAEAERLARARGLSVLLPRILGNLAEIALQRADFPEAQERFARALRAAEQVGDRKALALTSGGAGDLAFVRGDLAAAEEHYRRAEALFSSLGSRYLAGIRLHLAALDLVRGGTAGEGLLRAAAGARDPLHAALARLALAGAAGSAEAFAEHVAAAAEQLARGGEHRRVLVRLADLAADRAAREGWTAAAEQARALARAHEARLDMAEEA